MPWFTVPIRREETHVQLGEVQIEAGTKEDALLSLKLGVYEEDAVSYSTMSFEISSPWEWDKNYPVKEQ